MVQKDVAVAVHRIGFDRLELHELQAVRVRHDPCHLNSRIRMASRWIASTDQHAMGTVTTISHAVCVREREGGGHWQEHVTGCVKW